MAAVWQRSIEGKALTSCGGLPFPFQLMLASKLDNSTQKPLQNNIGREKDRYQSSVTQVGCPWLYLSGMTGMFFKE